MNIIDITSAIKVLRPNAKFMVRGDTYEGIENWVDDGKPPPTKKEIESEIIRQQAEYDALQYQRDRASSYPSWQTQMDMLYHKGVAGWKAEIKKVKDAYPKPSE